MTLCVWSEKNEKEQMATLGHIIIFVDEVTITGSGTGLGGGTLHTQLGHVAISVEKTNH